jgi:NADPH-dependent 2,4-dienoyl-CoA reductase/sulfur reductase-like enzyme/rhodanese-related sulfurtransferase/TusA-related sulfurtransferase
LNIDVHIRHQALAVDTDRKLVTVLDHNSGKEYTESWDKLVLCGGAKPIRPPTPGDDNPRIFTLQNVSDMDQIIDTMDGDTRHAVIIGGGFIGIEMAECLVERGLQVDLVELGEQTLPFLDPELAHELEGHMIRKGVRIHLKNQVTAFHDENSRVICELKNKERITADIVISAIGVRPSTELARDAGLELGSHGGIAVDKHMCTSHPDIYAAGDAVEVTDLVTGTPCLVPLAGPANRQGRIIADNLCGRSSTFAPVQGTSIIKVFDMTAACTGASEKRLINEAIPYEKAYVHPPGHASYYPGTTSMHLKLLFSPADGKVLGAQAIGFDGVDKRIDVLAVALRAGMTVYDLEGLELAYAPPYSSAKDPVNMAGFVAANILRGDAPTWYAEDFAEHRKQGVILDVRSVSEYEQWHLPGSINIPNTELRARIAEIPEDKPVYAYCRSGFRSYLAVRILKQSGFDQVFTLSGGATTFHSVSNDDYAGSRLLPEVNYGDDKLLEMIRASGKQVTLDATGMQCPGPIDVLKTTLDQLTVGDDVIITADDPTFVSHLPSWCRSYGHQLLEIQDQGNTLHVLIRKGLTL